MKRADETMRDAVKAWLKDARNWHCPKCGEYPTAMDGAWRWNGHAWEHHHDYPVGHIEAIHTKDKPS